MRGHYKGGVTRTSDFRGGCSDEMEKSVTTYSSNPDSGPRTFQWGRLITTINRQLRYNANACLKQKYFPLHSIRFHLQYLAFTLLQ